MTIFHITTHKQWAAAQAAGAYRGDTLATEGFIHCSTVRQVLGVANALFRGQAGLVLLQIDPKRLHPELRYEAASNGEHFPHIYGPLNLDAVSQIFDFPTQPNGTFVLPIQPPQQS